MMGLPDSHFKYLFGFSMDSRGLYFHY